MFTLFVLAGLVGSPLPAQVVGSGTGGNCFPFGCVYPGSSGTRYQQVYDASNFSGSGYLEEIRFFLHTEGGFRPGTYEIFFSTTTAPVNGLDLSDFDSNLGADNFLFGSYFLSGWAPTILSFAGSPFHYDPSLGNLLMDIRFTSSGGPEGLASFQTDNGTAAGWYSRAHDYGGGYEDWGLKTEFVFADATSTVPEPATMTLLATGLAGMATARRRRKD